MSRTQFEVEIEELEKLGVKLQNLSNICHDASGSRVAFYSLCSAPY
jgi:hypothetical protein